MLQFPPKGLLNDFARTLAAENGQRFRAVYGLLRLRGPLGDVLVWRVCMRASARAPMRLHVRESSKRVLQVTRVSKPPVFIDEKRAGSSCQVDVKPQECPARFGGCPPFGLTGPHSSPAFMGARFTAASIPEATPMAHRACGAVYASTEQTDGTREAGDTLPRARDRSGRR